MIGSLKIAALSAVLAAGLVGAHSGDAVRPASAKTYQHRLPQAEEAPGAVERRPDDGRPMLARLGQAS